MKTLFALLVLTSIHGSAFADYMTRSGIIVYEDDGGGYGGSISDVLVFLVVWAALFFVAKKVLSALSNWSDELIFNVAFWVGGVGTYIALTQ